MISNVLDQFLNESTTGYGCDIEKPEPLSESESFFITPDANGVALLKEQDERDIRRLDMAMLKLNSVVLTEGYKLNMPTNTLSESAMEEKRMQIVNLQEAGIVDYWNKFIEMIKKAWQRMVTWFKNLFKSISVAVMNVKKSLKGVDKILKNKDFSNFTYDGHDWKDSTIYATMASNIESISNELSKDLDDGEKLLAGMKATKLSGENEDEIKMNNSPSKSEDLDYESKAKEKIGQIVGKGETSTSMEQAKDIIAESYGYSESKTITGCDWKGMVEYLTKFNDSKTITESQKTCDANYKKLIAKAEKMKSAISSASADTQKGNPDATRTIASRFNYVEKRTEKIIQLNNKCLSAYDTLIGYCITVEKARFSEYRSVISKAIRYNGK